MIEPYYIIVFSTISGSISYLIWKIFEMKLSKKKRFKYLYHMLLLVAAFYLLPFFYLGIRALIILQQKNLKKELLYLWIPRIAEVRTILAFFWLCGVIWSMQNAFHKLKGMVKLRVMNVLPAEKELVQLKNKIVKELGIRQEIDICRSYSVISPMVIGIVKKTVYLPVTDYEQREMEILLYHELIHVKQHITSLKNLVVLLQVFQWFNPCVYVLMGALDEWSETLCDLSVHYNTSCNTNIKEYFGFAMKEAEKEQAMLSGFLTKLQRMKGLSARFEKVRVYNKENELRLTGGILIILLFLMISSTSSLVISAGVSQVHNSFYEITDIEDEVQQTGIVCIEYKEILLNEDNISEMSMIQQGNKNLAFNNEVLPGKLLVSNIFEVNSGEKIKIMASVTPSNVETRVGIITPSKTIWYSNGEDMFSCSFSVDESGKYSIFIENETEKEIFVEGLVSYSH